MLGVHVNATQTNRFTVAVTAQANANQSTSIRTKCWVQNGNELPGDERNSSVGFDFIVLSCRKGGEITDAKETPVRIYAQVWKGDHPVAGASVKYICHLKSSLFSI